MLSFEKTGLWVGDLTFENWSLEEEEKLELIIFRKLKYIRSKTLLDYYGFELGKMLITLLLIAHLPFEQIAD